LLRNPIANSPASSPGRAYTADEKARMLAEAAKLRSKNMYPALVVVQ